MKKSFLPLLLAPLIFSLLPARADILANGDFALGAAHWAGDAHAVSDTENKGIVIQLDPTKWTKISQVFNTRENALNFSLDYTTSPDCAFISDPGKKGEMLSVDDLMDMIGTRFKHPIRVQPGAWLMMIVDPPAAEMTYHQVKPTLGSHTTQTAQDSIPYLVAHEEKTIYLAFPPGKGSVTLLKISLTARPQGSSTGQ